MTDPRTKARVEAVERRISNVFDRLTLVAAQNAEGIGRDRILDEIKTEKAAALDAVRSLK